MLNKWILQHIKLHSVGVPMILEMGNKSCACIRRLDVGEALKLKVRHVSASTSADFKDTRFFGRQQGYGIVHPALECTTHCRRCVLDVSPSIIIIRGQSHSIGEWHDGWFGSVQQTDSTGPWWAREGWMLMALNLYDGKFLLLLSDLLTMIIHRARKHYKV